MTAFRTYNIKVKVPDLLYSLTHKALAGTSFHRCITHSRGLTSKPRKVIINQVPNRIIPAAIDTSLGTSGTYSSSYFIFRPPRLCSVILIPALGFVNTLKGTKFDPP